MERKPRGRPRKADRPPEQSRQDLLDAAAAEIAERGFASTTVERIAERAGLSKGTFYWNFASKDDLFVALIEERLDEPVLSVLEVMHRAGPGEPTGATVSRGLADLFARDPDAIALLHEHWSAARRDERHAERYRRRHAAQRDALALALQARFERTGVVSTMPVAELAGAFIALATGLGMLALVDPGSVGADVFGDIASLVYDGMVRRSEADQAPDG